MGILSNIMMIGGMMAVDGQPIADQSLMLVDPQKKTIVSVAQTDREGHFSIEYEAPQDGHPFMLLAKFRYEDIATIEAKDIATTMNHPDIGFHLQSADLVSIVGHVEAKRMKPMEYSLTIDLVTVDGLDPGLIDFLHKETEKIINSTFCTRAMNSDHFQIRVKPGAIQVDVERIYIDDPRADERNMNYVATEVFLLPQKTRLTGRPFIGYSLTVNAPTKIKVVMKPHHLHK